MSSRALLALGLLLVTADAAAAGETVYRWTDERGVVHFADSPPRGVRNVESRTMPPAPTRAAEPPSGAASAAAPDGTPAPAGPARVVISAQENEAVGDTRQALWGKVRNTGGQPARDVVVGVTVISTRPGEVCVNQEIDVEPATLDPGKEGTFEVEVESPCFRDDTQVQLRVDWR